VFFSLLLSAVSATFVAPVFATARLFHLPYLGRGGVFFCELDWADGDAAARHYTIVTNAFHFALTLVAVSALYAGVYRRLRTR
jgi:hypothetical protein